mgnify:CR=1 FL=1
MISPGLSIAQGIHCLYRKYFDPQDLYVINHNPDKEFSQYLQTLKDKGINIVNAYNDKLWNEIWRRDIVNNLQHYLVTSYKAVIYNDVDELNIMNEMWDFINNKKSSRKRWLKIFNIYFFDNNFIFLLLNLIFDFDKTLKH